MKTKLSFCVITVLSLMALASVCMGVFWLPEVFSYLLSFLSGGALLLFGILCALIALIFLGILLSAFAFPKAMAEDKIFTPRIARRSRRLSVSLFADSVLLCAAALWLIGAGERLLMPAMLFVSLIGAVVALAVYALSDYIARAAVLKEEAELTL